MRKTISVLGMLALCASVLCAATPYSTILSSAMANSPSMKNSELSYQNSLLTQQRNDLDDVVQVTVSSGNVSIPLYSEGQSVMGRTTTPSASMSPSVQVVLPNDGQTTTPSASMSPSVQVVLPNDGQTTITASSGISIGYDSADTYTLTPALSASHSFDLTGYDSDLATSLSNARSALQSEMVYQQAKLSFESQVLSSIRSIVQAEQSLVEAEYNLEKARTSLENDVALGKISTTSVSYQQRMNSINLKERTIDATRQQIATACQQYTTLTGLVWDGVEDLPEPDLTLNILESGNTNVILAGIDVEIAQQAIETEVHRTNPSSINVAGNASMTYSDSDRSLSAGGTVAYQAGNWSISGGLAGTYDNARLYPSLTVAGSWTNKTTKRSDDLQLQMLNNNLISAQNDLTDARTSYIQSAQSLQIDILNHSYTLQNTAATKAYLVSNLEYTQTLFDAGLCNQETLTDAKKEVEWAEVDDMINTIDGLILQNRIAQLNV